MKQKEIESRKKQLKIVDKRRVGKDATVKTEEPNLKPTYVQQLEQKVSRMETALRQKIEELENDAQKSRERVKRDLEKRFDESLDKIFIDLFDIFESINKAVEMSSGDQKTKEGLELIKSSLERFMEKNNVEKINPVGEEFDPNSMEALQTVKGEKDKVVNVLQKGYLRNGKILKAAKVSVGIGDQ